MPVTQVRLDEHICFFSDLTVFDYLNLWNMLIFCICQEVIQCNIYWLIMSLWLEKLLDFQALPPSKTDLKDEATWYMP